LPITPIDDLDKINGEKSQEDFLRCKLASVYRLVDLKGWSWSVYNHITVKLPEIFN
jgi:adducin